VLDNTGLGVTEMDPLRTDILVIGSGGAGLLAAVEAANMGASVTVVDKGLVGKSGSTVGAQQIAAAIPGQWEQDSAAVHYQDTVASGQRINDARLVKILVEDAPERIAQLEDLGLIFERRADGKFKLIPMNGHTHPRSLFHSDITGKLMLDVMRVAAGRLKVNMIHDVMITSLLCRDGWVLGAVGLDFGRGKPITFHAKAVIIATGGAGRLYPLTSNPVQTTGDGIALALRSGAVARDLEFYQFYPVTVLSPQTLRGFAMGIAQFGRLYNNENHRFMEKYDPKAMEGATRDRLSFGIFSEIRAGNGSKNGGVYLDVTGLAPDVYESFASEVELCAHHGIDLKKDRVEVSPCSHYFMGGILINENCEATIKGLYVAGEAAGGVHGANRLGNNSLTDAVVFGARAGRSAGAFVKREGFLSIDSGQTGSAIANISMLANKRSGSLQPSDVINQLQTIMWEKVGIIRNEKGLGTAIESISELEDRLAHDTRIISDRLLFNRQVNDYVEAENMLLLGKSIALAAMTRQESRGAHYREDYRESNDAKWLVNTEIVMDGSAKEVRLSPCGGYTG
jgi:fumarate reductase (CoM/CoB) subunit A